MLWQADQNKKLYEEEQKKHMNKNVEEYIERLHWQMKNKLVIDPLLSVFGDSESSMRSSVCSHDDLFYKKKKKEKEEE
jgi:hypothetical protein